MAKNKAPKQSKENKSKLKQEQPFASTSAVFTTQCASKLGEISISLHVTKMSSYEDVTSDEDTLAAFLSGALAEVGTHAARFIHTAKPKEVNDYPRPDEDGAL